MTKVYSTTIRAIPFPHLLFFNFHTLFAAIGEKITDKQPTPEKAKIKKRKRKNKNDKQNIVKTIGIKWDFLRFSFGLLLVGVLGMCCTNPNTIHAQCDIPISIVQTDYECNDTGQIYAVEFMLNKSDVTIEEPIGYEMHKKITGEFGIYGIPADEKLEITINDNAGCTLDWTFEIPDCILTFTPYVGPTDVNRYHILLPTAFSPNEDGLNDEWRYVGDNIIELNVKVFNRWGNVVFESNDMNYGWDGYYEGYLQPTGTYTYIAQVVFEDGMTAQKHGSLTLVR